VIMRKLMGLSTIPPSWKGDEEKAELRLGRLSVEKTTRDFDFDFTSKPITPPLISTY